MTQSINKIEIQGTIGSLKVTELQKQKVLKINVATSRIYQTVDGAIVEDTTWFTVVKCMKKNEDTSAYEKGKILHANGFVRMMRYTGTDGIERIAPEIVAKDMEIVS